MGEGREQIGERRQLPFRLGPQNVVQRSRICTAGGEGFRLQLEYVLEQ